METRRDGDELTWHRIAAVQFKYRMRNSRAGAEAEAEKSRVAACRVHFTPKMNSI